MRKEKVGLQNANHLLRSQVYDYLRDQMKCGALKPGSFIKTGEIIEELGVSKTPLRDAFIQLQAEGFLTILPQRGVKINGLTAEDVTWMYEILGALESRVIVSVFSRLDETAVSELKRLNAGMREAIPARDFHTYNSGNIKFHDVFLNLSENEPLVNQVRLLKLRLYDFPNRDYGIDWETVNADEHQEFIELVEKDDATAAADFMRDVHWVFRNPEVFA
jgi:DNA-binding GntR family transcriptional regulator